MRLEERLQNLNAIDNQWAIYADAPFTVNSESRIGQTQFEKGGVLDDKEFVGTLESLSPDYEQAKIEIFWGEIEDSVANGIDSCEIDWYPDSVQKTLDVILSYIEDGEFKDVYPAAELQKEVLEKWVQSFIEDPNATPDDLYNDDLYKETVSDAYWFLRYTPMEILETPEEIIDRAEESRQERLRLKA